MHEKFHWFFLTRVSVLSISMHLDFINELLVGSLFDLSPIQLVGIYLLADIFLPLELILILLWVDL